MDTYFSLAQETPRLEVFTLETIKVLIDEEFKDSFEDLYWKKRLRGDYKKLDKSRSFGKRKTAHKKRCVGKYFFKKTKKWYGYDEKYMDYEAYIYENGLGGCRHPYRRRAYCSGCKKTKALFSEKEQADNFIKYNQEAILRENGYAPVRSYYCPFCLAWHVTSIERYN